MNDPEIIKTNGATFKRLISAKEIEEKIVLLAQQIRNDMGNAEVPVFLCVLKGAFIFAADLVRNYNGLCELQFLRISSYNGADSTGKVTMYPGLDVDMIKGRRVVVVEDIVDTGRTMRQMLSSLRVRHPKSVDICTLFLKPDKLEEPLDIKYAAFTIPNNFIVGYGLDYDQLGRGLKEVYTLVE